TRPDTAVAVPATTAVRAAMPTRPGPRRIMIRILPSALGALGERVLARREDDVAGDAVEVEHLTTRVADGRRELGRPDVLPDEQRGPRRVVASVPRGLTCAP